MNENGGWISLYRKFTEWEWYKDIYTKTVFLHLLLKANHREGYWKGQIIQRGQLITGRKSLAEELDISEQNVRTALEKLKLTNEITIESTNKYSVVTITKYDFYQNNNQQLTSNLTDNTTNNQPTSNQQLTTNNKNNNNNNIYYYLLNKYKSNDFPPSTSIIERVRKDPDYLLLDCDDRMSLEMELML